MTTWAEYRTAIRDSVLKDIEKVDDEDNKWSNADLLIFYRWATAIFANHTSYYVDESIVDGGSQDFSTKTITLSEIADDQWWTNAVVTIGDSVEEDHYLASNGTSFTFDSDVELDTSDTVRVRYFAFYPIPTLDTDVIAIPAWAESALTHLVAYFALQNQAVPNASVNQWNTKRDSGNPEHNAVQEEQKYLWSMYMTIINLRSKQDRDKVLSI